MCLCYNPLMDPFTQAYNSLNAEQKRAVDTIDGPVMVVAGPGTGKTQILTLRIANILRETDTEPEQILALTFTEAAAQNMRARLTKLIGNAAYRVVINTFHGFCNDIIRRYPEDFPKVIGSKPVTDVDQMSYIEEIIEHTDLVLLKPYGDRLLYVRDIVARISELKREGVTPERFAALVQEEKNKFQNIQDLYHAKGAHVGKMKGGYIKLERKILKNEELARVYHKYQEMLMERKGYDFSDMILEVLTTLETNQALLQLLQEEHQYVLVDEHQDTNNAQNRILELIMSYHDRPNLFVVGDEKQAVFRFQGASLENFQYFKHTYKDVQLITLTQNYRSTQTVLDAADALLASGLKKNAPHTEAPIHIGAFSTPASERYYIVHDIKEKIDSGIAPHEIAILFRNNRHAFAIARDLARLGIPHQIESEQDLFSQGDIAKLLIILRAIANYGDDIYVAPLLHISLFGIDPLDAYKLLRSNADAKKKNVYELMLESDIESIKTTGEKLKQWTLESRKQDLLSFFEYIVRETGLLGDIVGATDASERFDAINALFDQVRGLLERKPDATLVDFFVYLETVQKHKLFIKRQSASSREGKVRLMTVHKSKGLEFAHVYIIGAVHGVFGGGVDRDRLPLIESVYGVNVSHDEADTSFDDERRLFYVALTRAKESVTITYAHEDEGHRETLPSEFITEIKPELVEQVDSQVWEQRFANDKTFAFTPINNEIVTPESEQQFVNELFDKQGFSPTALNNYLECPWKYFYTNLLRIPTAQNKHQAYGTAIHGALADFHNALKSEPVGKEYLLAAFDRWINTVPLAPSDFAESKAKGERALSVWYDAYEHAATRSQNEFRINGVEYNGTRLTGVLDKIEWNDDDTVTVTDYKTGKPKTRNELMGKTKNSDGNYYRQLTFYKLLLELFKDGQHVMSHGVIDFVEPDEKGICHKESFAITTDEVIALKSEIDRVAHEIRTLAFWDKRCDDKECPYCALRVL